MQEITIKNLKEYRNLINSHGLREWIYRGQNNYGYSLESSLFRVLERNKDIQYPIEPLKKNMYRLGYEKEMLESFKRRCHIFLQSFPDKDLNLDWLALMQHYGAPTRLLDFTFSPYIALYFAISGAGNAPVSVFCINRVELEDRIEKKFNICEEDITKSFNRKLADMKDIKNAFLFSYEPKFVNERLFVQQGLFLVSNSLHFSHDAILKEIADDDIYIKIKIEHKAFKEIINELYKMNISATTLYPGFEGFCKSFENIGAISLYSMQHLNDFS